MILGLKTAISGTSVNESQLDSYVRLWAARVTASVFSRPNWAGKLSNKSQGNRSSILRSDQANILKLIEKQGIIGEIRP